MSISNSITGGNSSGVSGGSGDTVGPSSSTDNALVRFDGATGKLIQDGVVVESDAGALSGLTQLTVDNLRLDGNTLSSIDANGDVFVAPNGTGRLQGPIFVALGGLTSSFPALKRNSSGVTVRFADDSGAAPLTCGTLDAQSTASMRQVEISNGSQATFSDGTDRNRGLGAIPGAQGVRVTNGSTGIGVLEAAREIEANVAVAASPNLLLATESRKLLTNEGATAENYHTLPSAAAGLDFEFYAIDSDGLRVGSFAGDEIEIGGVVSAVAGFIRLQTNASARLVAVNATRWKVVHSTGTITVDV